MKPRTDWEKQRDLALEWAKEQRDEAIDLIDDCNKYGDDRTAEFFHRDYSAIQFIISALEGAVKPVGGGE